ncbi:MAG: response regulator [Desulfobaccales bacterium]
MSFLYRLSFRSKIMLGISAVILTFGLLSAIFVSRIATQTMLTEIKKRGLSLGLSLAARTADPLLALDFLRLKNMVDEVKESSDDIVYVFVQERSGQVMSHTFKGGFPVELKEANEAAPGVPHHTQLLDIGEERVYDFAIPVTISKERLGTVRLGLSQVKAQAAVQRLLLIIFGVSAGAGVVALVLGSLFAGTVSKRLNLLRESAEQIVKGNLDLQTAPRLKRNCWDIKECHQPQCPAYGDTRRRCWYLVGTMCPECAAVEVEQKIESCRECEVYQEIRGDEIQSLAEAFDFMALNLHTYIENLKETERTLTRQQQLFKTILDVTPDLVSLQDENLVYRAVNPAFCQFFGMMEEDIIGKTDAEVFPQLAERHRQEDLQILATGQPMSKELPIGRNHRRHWLHLMKMPVYDEDCIAGLLLTARDITEIKQYQEKLVQSVKMEQLGKLAGGVAHEINTPLCIILGYAQMLLEDMPRDLEGYEFLTIIEKQAQICRRIVGDLLSFSRQIESKMEKMDLNESIQEVLHLVQHTFKQHWVEIETDLAPDLPAIVGDKEKLKQVWINLLNNAFDSIGEDGAIWVITRRCPRGRRVLVAVADTGAGIEAEDKSKIFDPFFTTKAPGVGTGLGLSVSFGIIQDHHGTISVHSPAGPAFRGAGGPGKKEAGPGSVFVVELPVSPDQPETDSCEELLARLILTGNQKAIKEGCMGEILVLDDVLDAGVMMKRILERKGHRVMVFTEEEEALGHIRSHRVDVAILDIRLKKLSGIDMLEEINRISPTTRVIMLTGYPTLETARQAQQLGAFDYCIKPIDKEELEAKVASALEASP